MQKVEPMEQLSKYLNEKDVAMILGLSVKTLQNWRWRGVGLAYHKIGRSVKYLATDVTEYEKMTRIDPENQARVFRVEL